jgi:hypothetical protein
MFACQTDEHSEEVTVFMHINNICETFGMVSLATLAIHNDQLCSLADHADFQIHDWLTHSYATLHLIPFTFHMFFTKETAPYVEMTSICATMAFCQSLNCQIFMKVSIDIVNRKLLSKQEYHKNQHMGINRFLPVTSIFRDWFGWNLVQISM